MIIKAISLWEPWASLMATCAKRYETRHWATHYRGPMLITAALRCVKRELEIYLENPEFQAGLAPLIGHPLDLTSRNSSGVTIADLQFGMAVAIGDLVNCIPTETMTDSWIGTDKPFGNFQPGRFAWRFDNLRKIQKPFAVHGRQGIFNVEGDPTLWN